MATTLRRRLNEVFEEEQVPWAAYGTFSSIEIFTNPERDRDHPDRVRPAAALGAKHFKGDQATPASCTNCGWR